MKNIKSLTCLFLVLLVSACNGHPSAAFSSSSIFNDSSSTSSSSSEIDTGNHYNGYYDSLVSWTNGEDLKNQLNAIIRNGYTPLSYTKSNKQNYDTNIHADHSKDDFEYLDVIYSKNHTFKTDTNKGWQREHAWCASLMCGQVTGDAIKTKGRATDFHNLFAANASGNQSRGNKNYGNANKQDATYVSANLTDNGKDGYSYDETTFEPADIDKGRLARAIFYMATMYKDAEDGMPGLRILEGNVSYPFVGDRSYAIGNLTDLLNWNNTYQVDYLEMQHNIAVYTDSDNVDGVAQGNRNPFVDYPGLVDYVYGNKKNQPGSLTDVRASIVSLGNEEHTLSHYAIKEAKREYDLNEKLTAGDYKINAIYNDFSIEDASAISSIHNSLDTHVFTESDGDTIEASIITTINVIKYQIILNPMGLCSSGTLMVTTTGINKRTPNTDQNVSFSNVPFLFNFMTSYSSVSTDGMTINNISAGGITIGSTNRVLTKLTITTKDSYTADKAFIKAQAGNASSSYTVTIKVGNTTVYTGTVNDSSSWKVFGGALAEPVTGQITFVFTGSSCLKINSVAFNSIIA